MLAGVFFHKNSNYYNNFPPSTYDENNYEVINIYFLDGFEGVLLLIVTGVAVVLLMQFVVHNLMDYGGGKALTPQQLGRIHWTIENEKVNCKASRYLNNMVTITNNINSFTGNKSYVCKKVIIPNNTTVSVANGAGIYISAKEFEIKSGSEFEIGTGSILNIHIDLKIIFNSLFTMYATSNKICLWRFSFLLAR